MDGLDQDDPATGKRGVEHRTSNIERPTSNIEVEEGAVQYIGNTIGSEHR
jgi:hypothetical protein